MRNIDTRGWKLHLTDPESAGTETEYLSHGDSVFEVCQTGELDIVKAVVERTQVELEARCKYSRTPLHFAADKGHLPIV